MNSVREMLPNPNAARFKFSEIHVNNYFGKPTLFAIVERVADANRSSPDSIDTIQLP